MKNFNLTSAIAQLVVGLVCIGLGIYYFTKSESTMSVVFFVAGAVCIVMSVRTFMNLSKKKKDEKEDEERDKEE